MAQAAVAGANDNVFWGMNPPLDFQAEVNRSFRHYQVMSPNEMVPIELHFRYYQALISLENEANWADNEQRFIEILYFLQMPPWVQSRTFVRLAEGSFRFLASASGRKSRIKRTLISVVVHFFGATELDHSKRIRAVEAVCGLAEAELELQYERIKRDQTTLFAEDLEGINLVAWAASEFLSIDFAFHASRKKRQRLARLLISVVVYYPYPAKDLPIRPRELLYTLKDCLYSIGMFDVVQRDLLLAVSTIAANEAPRARARTIVKLFLKRVVTTGGLSVKAGDNILMRLCVRLYKFADDKKLIVVVRQIVVHIIRNYPFLVGRFQTGLSQVWSKYANFFGHEFDEEMNEILWPKD